MPRLASPDRIAGPDPAAGWPKRTNPPTPAAANEVDAPRSENSPLTMSSCSTRCGTGQLLTGGVHVEVVAVVTVSALAVGGDTASNPPATRNSPGAPQLHLHRRRTAQPPALSRNR